MNENRYRYVRFGDGSINYFIDSPAAREDLVRRGASEFSVHSFCQPLDDNPRPHRIWGDLHLHFDLTDSSSAEKLSDITQLLRQHDVTNQSVSAYYLNGDLEVIIAEPAFRGEIGSPCRFDFDERIRNWANADTLSVAYINNIALPMSKIPVLAVRSPEMLQSAQHPQFLANTLPGQSKWLTTPLAHEFYASHNRQKGAKDFLLPKHAYAMRCAIFHSLLHKKAASIDELATICALFGGNITYFRDLLHLHQRSDLIAQVTPADLKKARANRKLIPTCANIESMLRSIDQNYACHQRCPVSTPRAFPYTTGHDCPQGLTRENDVFSLKPSGLYAFNQEQNRWFRIMDPIWVNRVLPNTQNGPGAREIICHNVDGFPQTIRVSQKDFDSTALFSILQFHRVHVPRNNNLKGELRAYLAGQFTHAPGQSTARIADQSGWQNSVHYLDPQQETKHSAQSVVKTHNLPTPVKPATLFKDVPATQTSNNPNLLLGALASLTAPALAPLKTPGICLHFHGANTAQRSALLASISSISGHHIYKLPDALKHVADIKAHHKDSTFHIAEVKQSETSKMHRFLRRYFFGRKNKDSGTVGIVISTGESPLAPKESYAFSHKDRVLAIDLELPKDGTPTRTDIQPLHHTLVEALTAQSATLGPTFKQQRQQFMKSAAHATDKLEKQTISFLWLCATIGNWAYTQNNLPWWQGGPIQPLFQNITSSYSKEQRFIQALKHLALFIPTNAKLGDIPIKQAREAEELSKGKFLIPPSWMEEVIPPQTKLRQWLAWLHKNKIILPKRAKIFCGEHYSKKQGKTVRGYLVDGRAAHRKAAQQG